MQDPDVTGLPSSSSARSHHFTSPIAQALLATASEKAAANRTLRTRFMFGSSCLVGCVVGVHRDHPEVLGVVRGLGHLMHDIDCHPGNPVVVEEFLVPLRHLAVRMHGR